jgi:hypothetical protein
VCEGVRGCEGVCVEGEGGGGVSVAEDKKDKNKEMYDETESWVSAMQQELVSCYLKREPKTLG